MSLFRFFDSNITNILPPYFIQFFVLIIFVACFSRELFPEEAPFKHRVALYLSFFVKEFKELL